MAEQQASGMNSCEGSDGSLADRKGEAGFGTQSHNNPVATPDVQRQADFNQPNERGVDGATQGISPQPTGVR